MSIKDSPLFRQRFQRDYRGLCIVACMSEAKDLWADGKPKKLLYAIPVVLLWTAVIGVILYKIV